MISYPQNNRRPNYNKAPTHIKKKPWNKKSKGEKIASVIVGIIIVALVLIYQLKFGNLLDNDANSYETEVELSNSSCPYTSQNTNFEKYGIPDYSGEPIYILNNNVPYFTEDQITLEVFEEYSELDNLGRCGVAYANICKEIMPTDNRGDIGSVKPTGWHSYNYGKIVDGNYLYNRCHLIAFCLAGENANKKNLVTGTRYMNVTGMLPYEDSILDYVRETDNHVLYRVTPIFVNDELVCRGVTMEAYSVEDNGAGICFNVFAYNVQPQISIDYLTGESELIKY